MPKNGGRFIPCRGGGTDTTYYTDYHEVDENMVTIAEQGGRWHFGSVIGITQRHMDNDTTTTFEFVASRLIYLS